jgi:hypothetical protein
MTLEALLRIEHHDLIDCIDWEQGQRMARVPRLTTATTFPPECASGVAPERIA